jgi:hypothetical protein
MVATAPWPGAGVKGLGKRLPGFASL